MGRVDRAEWKFRPIVSWRRLYRTRGWFTFGLELTATPHYAALGLALGRRVLSLGLQFKGQEVHVEDEVVE